MVIVIVIVVHRVIIAWAPGSSLRAFVTADDDDTLRSNRAFRRMMGIAVEEGVESARGVPYGPARAQSTILESKTMRTLPAVRVEDDQGEYAKVAMRCEGYIHAKSCGVEVESRKAKARARVDTMRAEGWLGLTQCLTVPALLAYQ